jgi:hypothetical protein
MLKKNEKKVLNGLEPKDLVLDICGWDKPFNRANYILDIHQFETRGFHGHQGGNKEFFNKKTWIIHDVNSKKRLPFKDNEFDFIICSQILEDIRDPIWLCSEINRIGKAGYIEVPSMKVELTKGVADKKYAGYYHHRWLIEIRDNNMIFRFKPHFIHNNKKFHFPKRFLNILTEKNKVEFIFWEKEFHSEERIQISRDKSEDFIYNYVKIQYPRRYFYFFLDVITKLNKTLNRIRKIIFVNKYYHKYMDTKEFVSGYNPKDNSNK